MARKKVKEQIEKNTKENLELFQLPSELAIIDKLPMSTIVVLDHIIVYANPNALKQSGFDKQEFIGLPLTKFLINESLQVLASHITNKAKGDTVPESIPIKARHKTGKTIWLNASLSTYEINNKVAILLSWVDITSIKEKEATLLEHNLNLNAITDNLPYFVIKLDKDLRYQFVNKTFINNFNLKPEEIIGKKLNEFLNRERFEFLKPYLDKCLQGNRTVFESSRLDSNGVLRTYTTHLIPEFDHNNQVKSLYAITTEISEIKEITTSLYKSEHKLRKIADTIPVLINYIDKNLVYQFVNRAYENLLGLKTFDIVHKPLKEILGEELFNRLQPEINRVLSGETVKYDGVYTAPNGKTIYYTSHSLPDFDEKGKVIGFYQVIIDITEKVLYQQELEELNQISAQTRKLAKIGFFEIDLKTGKRKWSPELYDIYEVDKSQPPLTPEDFLQFVHPEDKLKLQQNCNYIKRLSHPIEYEFRLILPSKTKHLKVLIEPVKNENAENVKLIGVVQDITNLRSTEENLRKSEARLLKAQTIAQIGNFEIDLITKKHFLSDSLYKLLELEPSEELPNLNHLIDRIHPDDREIFKNMHDFGHLSPTLSSFEFRLISLKGEIKYLRAIIDLEVDDQGNAVKVSGILQDTTHLRLIENQLLESEERNREIFENAPVGIFQSSIEGRYIYHANKQFLKLFGYESLEDLQSNLENQGIEIALFKYPEQRPKHIEYLLHSEDWVQLELEYKRKDGTYFIGLTTARVVRKTGKPRIIEGFIEDITTRKEVEARIKASEAKYRNIFLAAKDAILLINGELGTIVDVNQTACEIYGYTRDELLQKRIVDLSANPSLTELSLKNRDAFVPLRYHKRKNGSMFAAEISASYFKIADSNTDYAILIVKDITERKKVQDALKASEELHRKLIDFLPVGVLILDINFNITYVTKRALKMFGYENEAEVLGQNALNWVVEDDYEVAVHNLFQYIKNKERIKQFFHLKRKDGSIMIAEITGTIVNDPAGKPSQIILSIHDLTNRLKTDEDLFESTEKFRIVYEISPVGIMIIEPNTGTITQSNAELSHILGYTSQELKGKTYKDLNHPDDIEYEKQFIDKIYRGEISSYSIEKRFINKSGKTVWVTFAASVVYSSDNKIIYAIGVVQDISTIKKLEAELKEREAKYKEMLETLNEVVWETDANNCFKYMSSKVKGITGFEPEVFIGKNYLEFIPKNVPYSQLAELGEKVNNQQSYQNLEIPVITNTGNYVWIEASGYPAYDREGNYLGYRGVSRDITAKKLAQQEILEREKVLKALADIQTLLLQPWQEQYTTDKTLEILGKATNASRSYLFIRYLDEKGQPYFNYENEWCAEGIEPYINNPEIQKVYATEPTSVLYNIDSPDWIVNSLVKDMSDFDKYYLSIQGIKSILLVALTLDEKVVGFIGLDNCHSEELFSPLEVTLLQTVGKALSQAYSRYSTIKNLEARETQLRALLDNIPVMLWTTDMSGTYNFIEGKLIRENKIDPNDYLNKNVFEKTAELGHPKVKTDAIKLALAGYPTEYYLNFQGRHYQVIVSPLYDSYKIQTGIIGVTIDITEQYKTQEKLRQSESKYRMLVETLKDGLLLTDENSNILFANQHFAKLFGKELKEIIGLNVEDLLEGYSDEIKQNQEQMYNRRVLGYSDQYEMPFILPDGRTRWIRVSATPVMINGEYKGCLSILHDFTELKESELKQKELISSLEKAMMEIKTLSGLIPICSYCKKIRDDTGYWNQLEAFLAQHTAASFSHSICPECYKKLMSEFENKSEENNPESSEA